MNEKKILGILMKQTLNRKIAQLLSKNCLTKLGGSCMLPNCEKIFKLRPRKYATFGTHVTCYVQSTLRIPTENQPRDLIQTLINNISKYRFLAVSVCVSFKSANV